MKSSLNRAALVCAVLFLLLPAISRADQITLSISQRITGTLDGTPFANKLVTYSPMFTSENLAACVANGDCSNDYVNSPVLYLDATQYGVTATWTIEGFGTFEGYSNNSIMFRWGGTSDPHDLVIVSGGDVEGRGGLPNPALPQQDCDGLIVCPTEAATSGGTIQFLDIDGPPSFSVQVVPENAPVPEPSAFMLLGAGVSALGMVVSRRRRA